MKTYPKYKDSGIPWMGKIPEEWELCKMKSLTDYMRSGGTPTSNNLTYYTDEGGLCWVAIGDMSTTDIVYNTAKHITEEGRKSKNLCVFPKGTLLYSIYASIGKVAELAVPATINQAILAIKLNEQYLQTYCKYVLRAYEKHVASLASANTQANLSAEKVANFILPVPSLAEQQAIAEYLDKKTGDIDELVGLLNKQIADVRAYRQSLITETVTQGLNKDVPMKDSGVEWIGQIPEGWEIRPLKTILSLLTDGTHQTPHYVDKGIPFISIKDMSSGKIDFSNTKFISREEHLTLSQHAPIEKGDIIFSRIGTLGVFIKVDTDLTFDIFVSLGLMKLIPNQINTDYLVYYLSSAKVMNYINMVKAGEGTSAAKFNLGDVKETSILFPSSVEQQQIVEFLDAKTKDIDELLSNLEAQVADLLAYKSSLISEVVTGKIDIR